MNQRTSLRIQRQELPPVMRGRTGYRNAEPHLRRDFGFRCAYCSVHEQIKGGPKAFCIDHFKPRSKGGPVNDYTNLYWVCIPCNMIKHDKWPTDEQLRRGYRFADPCREQDAVLISLNLATVYFNRLHLAVNTIFRHSVSIAYGCSNTVVTGFRNGHDSMKPINCR